MAAEALIVEDAYQRGYAGNEQARAEAQQKASKKA